MRKLTLLLAILAMLALLPAAALANGDNPTIAFLRFGVAPGYALTDAGVLDMLQAYGYVNEDERATLDGGSDLRGENINLLYRHAGFDYSAASLMVEDALDEGADIMITVSSDVGLLAAHAISEMDDPPALIFAIVITPYDIGLADAPCIKPDWLGGTQMFIDWEAVYNVPFWQNPDTQLMGFIGDASKPDYRRMLGYMEEYVEDKEIGLETAVASDAVEAGLAAEQLAGKGVDFIFFAPHMSDMGAVAAIVNGAVGAPVFSAIVTDVVDGATIGTGFEGWYREGVNAARLAIGVLRGELDLASASIAQTPGHVIGVNLQSAEMQDVVISDKMLEEATYVVDLDSDPTSILSDLGLADSLPEMTLEERMAEDAAWLASLQCTDEMIAEQQAALEG